MRFQSWSEGVEGKSRPPYSPGGIKVVPQSRTGGRETPISEFVMCSRHEQLAHVIGVGAQWATTNVRQKATVVCEVRDEPISTQRTIKTKVCRYNWHSAGSVGWPFPVLKY